MSQITHLIRQIRALPFSDMMMVSQEIKDRIHELTEQRIEAVVLANILSKLQEGSISVSTQTDEEEKILRRVFKSKRSITITQMGKGWAVDSPTVPGAAATGTDLRELLGMMLDQVITLHVLTTK